MAPEHPFPPPASDAESELDTLLDLGLKTAFDAASGAFSASSVASEPPEEPLPEQIGKLRVIALLARGGLGVVLRAHDPELGRDVAVKFLQARLANDTDLLCLFLDEARIISQLQHPGIVPLHDLAKLPDGRSYYTMKIVEGKTLHEILKDGDCAHTEQILGVFESVGQTIAFAHSRGVVHGDLKPANIMVGAFGEVQVLDWGLARSMAAASSAQVGSRPRIAGTPGYMAPEQARGTDMHIDERTDVFALGSILCQVLTGRPAYTGGSQSEVYRRASTVRLDEAYLRLDTCGADSGLVAIAKTCLAANPEERFATAGAMVEELLRCRASIADRARRLEVDAAQAHAKAEGHRKARRLTLILAATVIGSLLLGGGAWLYYQQRQEGLRRAAERALMPALERARLLAEQAPRAGGRAQAWSEALAVAHEAEAFAASPHIAPELREQAHGVLVNITAQHDRVRRDEHAEHWLEEIRPHLGEDRRPTEVEDDYKNFFKTYGVDLDSGDLAPAAAQIRSGTLARQIADALHSWAHFRRLSGGKSPELWRRLITLADQVDGDPWRSGMRERCCTGDVQGLREMAQPEQLEGVPSESLNLLAECLALSGDRSASLDLYRLAHLRHPGDFWISHNLASHLHLRGERHRAEITRLMTAAAAARPNSAHALLDLSVALTTQDRAEDGLVVAERARLINPNYSRTWLVLAGLRASHGDIQGAIDAGRECVRQQPASVRARLLLANNLVLGNSLMEAEKVCREAVQLDPTRVDAQAALGSILIQLGYLRDALPILRNAVAMRGSDDHAWYHLGLALQRAGMFAEAKDAYGKTLQIRRDYAEAHCNLGLTLSRLGQFPEALAEIRKGHSLGSARKNWQYPTEQWLAEAEQAIEYERQAQAYLAKGSSPTDGAQALALARVLAQKGMHVPAAEWFERSLASSSFAPADTLLLAAQAAVQAADLDPSRAAQWRSHSLAWLTRAIELWEAVRDQTGVPAQHVRASLEEWLLCPELAKIRATESATDSGPSQAWQELWARVHAVLASIDKR